METYFLGEPMSKQRKALTVKKKPTATASPKPFAWSSEKAEALRKPGTFSNGALGNCANCGK